MEQISVRYLPVVGNGSCYILSLYLLYSPSKCLQNQRSYAITGRGRDLGFRHQLCDSPGLMSNFKCGFIRGGARSQKKAVHSYPQNARLKRRRGTPPLSLRITTWCRILKDKRRHIERTKEQLSIAPSESYIAHLFISTRLFYHELGSFSFTFGTGDLCFERQRITPCGLPNKGQIYI